MHEHKNNADLIHTPHCLGDPAVGGLQGGSSSGTALTQCNWPVVRDSDQDVEGKHIYNKQLLLKIRNKINKSQCHIETEVNTDYNIENAINIKLQNINEIIKENTVRGMAGEPRFYNEKKGKRQQTRNLADTESGAQGGGRERKKH